MDNGTTLKHTLPKHNYLELMLNDNCTVLIKAEDEGYVIDVYGDNPYEPSAGTWVAYNELKDN